MGARSLVTPGELFEVEPSAHRPNANPSHVIGRGRGGRIEQERAPVLGDRRGLLRLVVEVDDDHLRSGSAFIACHDPLLDDHAGVPERGDARFHADLVEQLDLALEVDGDARQDQVPHPLAHAVEQVHAPDLGVADEDGVVDVAERVGVDKARLDGGGDKAAWGGACLFAGHVVLIVFQKSMPSPRMASSPYGGDRGKRDARMMLLLKVSQLFLNKTK